MNTTHALIGLALASTLSLTACGTSAKAGTASDSAATGTATAAAEPELTAGDRAACQQFDTSMTEIRKVLDEIEETQQVTPLLATTFAETAAGNVREGAGAAGLDLTAAMEQTADSLDLFAESIDTGDVSLTMPAVTEADKAVTDVCAAAG